ncbi:hypothetical protein GOD34_18345 [Sinorhizobium medicae]|uniref:hypothetical protein n=1 Tax=Sinorhizobium medicae TaxID=110321 RepID=UPI000FDAD1C4|nr:hypothetical protein [Sinorhizobium medicae]MDX0438935.1 hypothetical protein [Sinorhizobium medicae]MDX0652727.1 hypothetical protein [Sinorhizobium medicae]MDX1156599.1 hypothetical protein [Sinorhizobium medicae]RVJ10226.1 hypothetical protein CN181_11210 [Sinorhizobium medicae]
MHNSRNSRIHDDDEGFWYFRDLKALGYVKDRTDLKRKQDLHGFPKPEKAVAAAKQAAAPFQRGKVRAWIRQHFSQAAEAE